MNETPTADRLRQLVAEWRERHAHSDAPYSEYESCADALEAELDDTALRAARAPRPQPAAMKAGIDWDYERSRCWTQPVKETAPDFNEAESVKAAAPLGGPPEGCEHDWVLTFIPVFTGTGSHSKPGATKCFKCGAFKPAEQFTVPAAPLVADKEPT